LPTERGDRILRWLRIGTLILPTVIALVWSYQLWQSHLSATIATNRQTAELLSQHFLRVIQTKRLLLDQIDRILDEHPDMEAEALHRRLAQLDAGLKFTTSLGVMDAQGNMIAGSRTYPLQANLSHRSYFQTLLQADTIVLDRVMLWPANRDALVLAKRRSGEDFQGVLTAASDTERLALFMQEIAAQPGSSAALLRTDGKVLLRHIIDEPPYSVPRNAPPMQIIAQSDAGVYDGPGYSDGVSRYYAVRRIGDLPLFAVTGVSKASVRDAWILDVIPITLFFLVTAILGFFASTQASQLLQAERALRRTAIAQQQLDEANRLARFRETLFKELNHRVRNNLMMVQGLMRLRGREAPEAKTVLEEIEQRVWAISEVHNILYNSQEYGAVDFGAFIRTLCNNPAIVPPEAAISLDYDIEPVPMGISIAMPAALIVLELLSNTMKHAFVGREGGRISVSLKHLGHAAEIRVRDDGIGYEGAGSRRSGLQLINGLLGQLRGTITFHKQNGTTAIVTIPLDETPPAEDAQPAEETAAASETPPP
jgi:two-component sensor histidine kinase